MEQKILSFYIVMAYINVIVDVDKRTANLVSVEFVLIVTIAFCYFNVNALNIDSNVLLSFCLIIYLRMI